jgi:hypothetical protein
VPDLTFIWWCMYVCHPPLRLQSVGKWHQGFASEQFTPHGRGFDRHFGFLGGGENHITQRINTGRYAPVDFWNSHIGGPDSRNGTFDTFTYWTELKAMLDDHYQDDRYQDDPLFLYLSLHMVSGAPPVQNYSQDEFVALSERYMSPTKRQRGFYSCTPRPRFVRSDKRCKQWFL